MQNSNSPLATTRPGRSHLPVFSFCIAACGAFVVLTGLAMLLYPGGSHADNHSDRYSFTLNFFSDLGRRTALNGRPNLVCSALFTLALTLAGLALATFFLGFARFFGRTALWKGLSWLGTVWGVFAGTCFVGVAWAPADVDNGLHRWFVAKAFESYLIAVFIYSVVIWFDGRYPKRMVWVFTGFAILLFGYIILLTNPPYPRTTAGLIVQVVAQKAIVYSSILCTCAQAAAAHFFARRAGLEASETVPASHVN